LLVQHQIKMSDVLVPHPHGDLHQSPSAPLTSLTTSPVASATADPPTPVMTAAGSVKARSAAADALAASRSRSEAAEY
jgi:hypothetical protein